jgi:hypothetical protein
MPPHMGQDGASDWPSKGVGSAAVSGAGADDGAAAEVGRAADVLRG